MYGTEKGGKEGQGSVKERRSQPRHVVVVVKRAVSSAAISPILYCPFVNCQLNPAAASYSRLSTASDPVTIPRKKRKKAQYTGFRFTPPSPSSQNAERESTLPSTNGFPGSDITTSPLIIPVHQLQKRHTAPIDSSIHHQSNTPANMYTSSIKLISTGSVEAVLGGRC